MFTKKSIGVAVACALALGAFSGAALATPVSVDGIQFDTSSPLYLTVDAVNFRETPVSTPGQVLHGYGEIAAIDGLDSSKFCVNGSCDLNFTFEYTLQSVVPGTPGGYKAVFTLGSINFFVDNTDSYDVLNPQTAGVGSPWLTLQGHTAPNSAFVDVGQLYSNINGTTAMPTSGSTGTGLLDATGGPASTYFNFNSFSDGLGGFADFQFNSSFLTNPLKSCRGAPTTNLDNACSYPIGGTGELIGQPMAVSVPEPGTIGMLGLGLGFLGLLIRRRRKEEAEGRA